MPELMYQFRIARAKAFQPALGRPSIADAKGVVRVFVLLCEACGRRTVTTRHMDDEARCVHCESDEVKVFSPLPMSISWGVGDYVELSNESFEPREDLIKVDAAHLL